MAMSTVVKVKSSMAAFLYDSYNAREREIKLNEHRRFSQNDYAREIGIVPQTLSRYINGDASMTMDQAIILLRYFGDAILSHFVYDDSSSLDAMTAEIIAAMPRLEKSQREALVNIIRAGGEEQAETDRTPVSV